MIKLLAWRIKKIQMNRAINSITLDNRQTLTDQVEINNALKLADTKKTYIAPNVWILQKSKTIF